MQKMILVAIAGLASGVLWAQTPAEAQLLSAQLAYQQALKAHTSQQGQLTDLQQRLNAAKQRLVEAQSNVQRLEGEVGTAQSAQTQADSALQTAGQQLDAAWAAVKGQ